MKLSKRYRKKIYLDPINNFSKIIDLAIFLENTEEWDFACEPISILEKIPSVLFCSYLIKDMSNRNENTLKNYAYQRLWWALINTEDEQVYSLIKNSINPFMIKMFNYWLKEELDPDVDTYTNIKKLI